MSWQHANQRNKELGYPGLKKAWENSKLLGHPGPKESAKVNGIQVTLIHRQYGLRTAPSHQEFARQYNLDVTAISRVVRGERKSHKGWRLPIEDY